MILVLGLARFNATSLKTGKELKGSGGNKPYLPCTESCLTHHAVEYWKDSAVNSREETGECHREATSYVGSSVAAW